MENVLERLMRERGIGRTTGLAANRLTRECLQEALVGLMREKVFERITITEIVNRSGVSRQSFYRNYRTKEDVLSDVTKEIIAEAQSAITDPKYVGDCYQWYFDLFTFIKENQEILRLLAKSKDASLLSLRKALEARTTEESYEIAAYEGAANAICRKWFRDGMKEDVEFMAHFCDSRYGSLHKRLLERLAGQEK